MDEIDNNIISLDYQVPSHYQDSLDINIISLDYQVLSHYQDSSDPPVPLINSAREGGSLSTPLDPLSPP